MVKDRPGRVRRPAGLRYPGRFALVLFIALVLGAPLAALPHSSLAAGRTPVILIPGVAGSTFKTGPGYTFREDNNGQGSSYQHTYGSNETVWVNVWEAALPGSDDYFDTMKMRPDADTPYVPYSNLAVSGLYGDAYNDLIDFMHRQGYVDNQTLFTFPYDWRRDIPTATFASLDSLIQRARSAAGTTQVDLVGHSMGGLVARSYISHDSASAAKVRRLITLGTPYLGSPKFLKSLLYGDQFGPTFLGLGLDPNEIKDLVQNMAGGWELLPSAAYYLFYDNSNGNLLSPYREDRDVDGDRQASGTLGYSGLNTFLKNLGKNQAASLFAQNFHELDSRWPAGPSVSIINGSGLATLGQVRDYTGSCWSWFRYVPCPKTDLYNIDGDGTVPFFSATPYDPARNLNFQGEASIHIVNREHGALVQYDKFLGIYTGDGPSLTLLGQILNNTVDPTGPASAALSLNSLDLPLAPKAARKTQPKRVGLTGYSISVTNDVQLEVFDNEGRHTGRKAGSEKQQYEQAVPGSSFDSVDGTQSVYLPEGGRYTLRLTAQAAGSFDLKIRMLDGDNLLQTVLYLNVQSDPGSKAELNFSGLRGGKELPVLRLEGKKVAPSAVLDAKASADREGPVINLPAPAVSASGSLAVNWNATDSQSGLLMQQGLLDADSAAVQVVRPGQKLRLPPGPHTLQVLAQDRAGNTSQREVSFNVP